MSDTIIKLENISKQYRLGTVGTQSLKGDLQRWWYNLRGKEDPTLKIGASNQLDTQEGEYVWALKDINLEVKQGEVLGIIGKNGAGKSTLLKLLSRVTGPTTGQIKVKGRIASLLEVGTGFHPELTGRENIFLNGAILGMTKPEIRSKFDEIVDFAGVAKYIDTPVKRYSSGMYVRLAFAVAAHLEPDILVVDEVLAVGDAEFQKKAIGKMQDVSTKGGRTVLFVSHNMTSIKNLCQSTLLMEKGLIVKKGPTEDIIDLYLSNKIQLSSSRSWDEDNAPGTDVIKIVEAYIDCLDKIVKMSSSFTINFRVQINSDLENFGLTLHLLDEYENIVFGSGSMESQRKNFNKGSYLLNCKIPANLMNSGNYTINVLLVQNARTLAVVTQILSFSIVDDTKRHGWHGKLQGTVRPKLDWQIM